MPSVIDSLLVRLGFSVDPKGLEGFAAKVEGLKTGMMTMGAAAAGAVYGIAHLVRGTSERMAGIAEFSEQMGLSARTVASLGKVARENGGSLEGLEQGLRQMTIMAGQAAQGIGRGAMIFKRFGLQVKDTHGQVKPVEQLLGDVADKLQKLPSLGQKLALGSRLGFDAATVKLLSEGREHFEALRNTALKNIPFADRDYAAALQTERLFKKSEDSITRLKDRIAVGLLPVVNAFLENTIKWATNENNIRKLKNIFGELASVLTFVVKHAKAAAFGFAAITLAMKGMNTLLKTSLLGAFLLVAEDLWVFYRGGTSVTGWMLTKFPYAVEVMEGSLVALGAALIGLSLGSGPVGIFAGAIGGIVMGTMAIHDAWNPLMQWFGEQWDWLEDKVRTFLKVLSWPVWAVLKLTGGSANVEAVYGKDRGPTGARKTLADLSKFDEKDFNERMAAFRQRNVQGGGVLAPNAGNMLTWGRGEAASNVNNTTTIGELHMNFTGTPKPEDAKKLYKAMMLEAQREGLTSGKDVQRAKGMNAAGGKAG